ncbi:hypothetical protein B7Z28_00755 [Candidatus Saccharibacteria bacterium 32-45-3]|nr:MAG: hypothetical protein B7Z28_00755 [Candidatus Saccharibacteria bacterium 32-45-3]
MLSTESTVVEYTSTDTLRLNIGDSAHFITHYSPQLLGAIIQDIPSGKLAPLDRLQILHEQTLIARAGIMNSANLIPLVHAYKTEESEAVWDIISLAIGELKKFIEQDEPAKQKLRQLVHDIALTQYEKLGWEAVAGESEESTKLRATIIGLMLYSEDAEAIQVARDLYRSTPLESLAPEIRSSVIAAEVRHGNDPRTVDTLLEYYGRTQSADLQQDIAAGITATKNQVVISKLLETIKNNEIIRSQDVHRWFVYLIRNTEGRELAWKWLKNNWQWVENTFAGDKSYDDFPRYSSSSLNTREQLNDFIAFFEPLKNVPALNRAITVGTSEIEGRVDLIERDSDTVRSALLDL